jgi:2,4-dienoyl-CoA reductase-like NADH-dependent reductase (Old Yellow Enzyme family)/thioredoxin reductase
MNTQFPNLYAPLQLGSLTLRNRIVAAPSSQGDIEDNGTLGKHNIAYYARKAQGGAALVTVGDGIVHPTGQDHPKQVYLYTDACLPSLTRCAEEIHKYGALASYELSHGGIVCDPAFIGGQRPFGPSEMEVTIGFQTENPVVVRSQEMTEDFMDELADAYAAAAKRCQLAGFDMVMVHAAHGWLIGQFFSPHTNHRTDQYGGSVENRARFAIMVLQRIRKAVGPRFPIEIRMNGRDGLDPDQHGLELEEAAQIARLLDPYVDSFHISSCMHMYPPQQDIMQSPIFQPHGHLVYLAEEIKKHVTKPVCTVGGLSDLAMMEDIVASGKADMVALGRQELADPDLPVKGATGRADQVRRCLRCATCQSGRFQRGTARCALNPEIGREYELQFAQPTAPAPKKVLIAGGGPGGMEAAIIAARRGHQVKLYEATDRLGGALNFAQSIDFKADLYHVISSMEAELKALPVEILLNTPLTPELARAQNADAIICAVGADAIRPPFPGIDLPRVKMADQADKGDVQGETVVVIGGGLVGVESALHLAKQGKKVSILEMLPNIANDANIRYARTYRWEIEKEGVQVYTSTKCKAITDDGVEAEGPDGKKILLPADTVVISVGMRPRAAASEALRDCAPIFIPIGNCVRPNQVQAAIRGGFDAAMYQI